MRVPVAVGQVPVCWSVRRNVGTVLDAIGSVAAGTVLVLPECALSGYDDQLSGLDGLDAAGLAAARDEVARAAQRFGVHVFCGTLLAEHGRWWNAAYYFPPDGEPWVYRKVNLAMHERGRLAAGAALPTAAVRLPSGVLRAGVQLCREIRFPEQWACLARQGAQVLIYLTYAVNPAEPPGVWRAHLISRAAETQRFVLAANVAGLDQHCPTMIVSPRGQVLAEAATGQAEIVRHTIDLAATQDGYLSQQRGDLITVTYRGPAG
jgi:predicted amidohydrolase